MVQFNAVLTTNHQDSHSTATSKTTTVTMAVCTNGQCELPFMKDLYLAEQDPEIAKAIAKVIPSYGDPEALKINKPNLYKIPLTPIDCSSGIVKERVDKKVTLQAMAKKERRAVRGHVTLVFAIRRPGCGSCREHAMQLAQLCEKEEKVATVGVMKDTDGQHDAVIDFYEQYFRRPVYRDADWKIYDALGNRQVSIWEVIQKTPALMKRWNEKKIQNVSGGEGFTQGGILVFDRRGELRFVYQEIVGSELNLEVLREAIANAKKHSVASGEDDWEDSVYSTCSDATGTTASMSVF